MCFTLNHGFHLGFGVQDCLNQRGGRIASIRNLGPHEDAVCLPLNCKSGFGVSGFLGLEFEGWGCTIGHRFCKSQQFWWGSSGQILRALLGFYTVAFFFGEGLPVKRPGV